MRKIDELDDTVHESIAEGDERVHGAELDAVDELLKEVGGHHIKIVIFNQETERLRINPIN
jgi:hypothetical protein